MTIQEQIEKTIIKYNKQGNKEIYLKINTTRSHCIAGNNDTPIKQEKKRDGRIYRTRSQKTKT